MLLTLGECSSSFVEWLESEEPLVRAYAACILANISFLKAHRHGRARVSRRAPLRASGAPLRDQGGGRRNRHTQTSDPPVSAPPRSAPPRSLEARLRSLNSALRTAARRRGSGACSTPAACRC